MATGRPKRPGWRAFNDLATNNTLLDLEPEIFVAWFQTMCAAQPHDGVIPMGIAKLYGWSAAKGVRYLTRLERAGLIEKYKQTFRVVHWAGAGTPPKTGAERLKRYRDARKRFAKAPVTLQDGVSNVNNEAPVTLQEQPVTLHDPPVTLQPPEEEKTQENQGLTSSNSSSLPEMQGSPLILPSPNTQTVVSNSEEKKEEPIVIVEGQAPAGVTLQAPKGKKAGVTLPDGFEAAWEAYPGRGQARNPRKTALAAYTKALTVKGATPDLILYGIKTYAEAMRKAGRIDTEFVAMMATWLNQQSWQQYAPVISSTASERLQAGAHTGPHALVQKVFVDEGTPAWDAWQAHLRGQGKPGSAKTSIMDEKTHLRREGWWFVSSYPPGHQNGKTESEQGRPAAEMEGEPPGQSNVTGSDDGQADTGGENFSFTDFGTTPPDEGFGG